MNINETVENVEFERNDILEIYMDSLFRKIGTRIEHRNAMDMLDVTLGQFLGMQQKTYQEQLLYLISDKVSLKQEILNYIEKCYQYFKVTVKFFTVEELLLALTEDSQILKIYDVVIIEEIDAFYDISDSLQEKVAKTLEYYLSYGGKMLVTGSIFDKASDSLGTLLYQGNVLNLTSY